jgi:hypothetical protein
MKLSDFHRFSSVKRPVWWRWRVARKTISQNAIGTGNTPLVDAIDEGNDSKT